MPRFVKYWLPLIIYGGVIFVQSSYPSPIEEPDLPFFDKSLHIVGYALLGALFCRAYGASWPGAGRWRITLWGIVSAGLYGVSDEIHQHFVPGRSAEVMDVAADIVGAAGGAVLYTVFAAKGIAGARRQAD